MAMSAPPDSDFDKLRRYLTGQRPEIPWRLPNRRPVGFARRRAEPTPPEAPPAPPLPTRPPRWAEKGGLGAIGALGRVPWENRAGAVLGVERVGEQFFAAVTPTVNWSRRVLGDPLLLSIGVPLRFELLDAAAADRFGNAMRFRTGDWDSGADFLKIVRTVRYGTPLSSLYAQLSAFDTGTLGHGLLLRRYNPNLSVERRRVSMQFDGLIEPARFETYLDDVARPDVFGARLSVRPLRTLTALPKVWQTLELSATVVADIDAPLVNRLDTADIDDDGRRGEIRRSGPDGEPEYRVSPIVGWGFDAQVTLLATDAAQVSTSLDVSMLSGHLPDADDEPAPTTSIGGTVGALTRFDLGPAGDHGLRARAELRVYESDYVPTYFDNLYRVQRVQYTESDDPPGQSPERQTKQHRIFERRDGAAFGGFAEMSYAYRTYFESAMGLFVSSQTGDSALLLHLGVPHIHGFSFHGTWQGTADASLLILVARAELGPWLHLNVEALTPIGFEDLEEVRRIRDVNVALEISFAF